MAVGGTSERRKQPRVNWVGEALVSVNGNCAVDYQIENISAGGAMLVGGPHLRPGRRVRVLLRLKGLPTIALDAYVLRGTEVQKPELAVRFTDLDPGIEDLIQDVVLSALSGRHLRPLPMDYAMKWEPLASEVHGEELRG